MRESIASPCIRSVFPTCIDWPLGRDLSRFIPLDEFDYHACLSATRGVALVLFGAPACGACKRAQALLPQAVTADTTLFRVDVEQAMALAHAFEIFHLPALFLYRDGCFHARIDCVLTVPALRRRIAAALAAPAEEEP